MVCEESEEVAPAAGNGGERKREGRERERELRSGKKRGEEEKRGSE